MSTSTVKQITIIHQYQTLADGSSNDLVYDHSNAFPKMNSHRAKGIVSIPKVHNSLKCNKQKPMSFIAEMGQLRMLPRRESQSRLMKNTNNNSGGYQKRIRFHTQIKRQNSPKLKTIENSDTKPKIKKIFLPNLKNFDDFDYQTDRIRPNHNKSVGTQNSPFHDHRSHDQETKIPQVHTQAKQISPLRLKQEIVTSDRRQQPYLPIKLGKIKRDKKIYKYISKDINYNSNQTRKPLKNEEDQQYTVSSFSPTYQKQSNVIFHNFKNKQMDSARNKDQSVSSSLAQSLFNLNKIKQNLNEFLFSYSPLNSHFDIKQFIRDPNVQILPTNNSIFVGKLINLKMEGKGILMTQKQLFEGQFINNFKKEGFQKNKNGIYQGFYQLGKRSGNGRFIWNNGQSYEGDWRFGKKNGHGMWRSLKGDYYEGQWKDNLQNGKGCYYHKGCSMYRGYFKNSLKHGRGEEQFENGDKYQGEYESGKPHGYGKYVWANEDVYEGQFSKGSRQGMGTLRKANGDKFEGSFIQDMKQGFGKETYKKGEYFKGYFEKGLKVSGSYFTKQGKQIINH